MRKLEWVFLFLGLSLLLALLDRVGLDTILRQFRQLGWYFLLVLVVSAGRQLARTVAWRHAFADKQSLPSFPEMFQVRVAGETLTYLSFAGPLLGEPAKATLLRRRLPLSVGLGGTMLEAGSYAVISGLVIVVGLPLALVRVTLDEPLARAAWVVTGLLAVTLFVLWRALRRGVGVGSVLLRSLTWLPFTGWLEQRRPRVEEVEAKLHQFYSQHTRSFRLMFLWDCVAQGFALLEIYVILVRLNLSIGLGDLFIFEAMSKIISTLFFFVPARLGTDEGGQAVVFQLLGFGLANGVGLALVQRLRGLTWSAGGIVVLARHSLRKPE